MDSEHSSYSGFGLEWKLNGIGLCQATDYFYTASADCVPGGPAFTYTYYITWSGHHRYLGSGCRQLQFVVGKFVVGVVAVDRKTNELIFEAPNAAISWLGLASSAAQGCGAAGLRGCGAAGRAAALCALWAAMH